MNIRRTKIIATLGPSTDKKHVLEEMFLVGVNLVRINLSHGTHAEHSYRVNLVRDVAKKLAITIGILLDLQGPKIRISKFHCHIIYLEKGNKFILDANLDATVGDEHRVGIDYKDLPDDVKVSDILLLDDGRIVLKVLKIYNRAIHCEVLVGGELSDHKGINRQGGGLSAEALTCKDKQDIKFIANLQADYVAVSFPRSAKDIKLAKKLLKEAACNSAVIAKIERKEAVECLDKIIDVADGVMVARGDLGVEVGYAELPAIQKRIINLTRAKNKAVITATQMMESMINSPVPTRAEVSDVANAVIDGSDAVMLSAETATGKYPTKVIKAMSEICLAVERQKYTQVSTHRLECYFEHIDEAIAMATMYTANHIDVQAIIAITETGSTPLYMSRIQTSIPIYAISKYARGLMTLYRGVYPIDFDLTKYPPIEVTKYILNFLIDEKVISEGRNIIITKGDFTALKGSSNTMKIVKAIKKH